MEIEKNSSTDFALFLLFSACAGVKVPLKESQGTEEAVPTAPGEATQIPPSGEEIPLPPSALKEEFALEESIDKN